MGRALARQLLLDERPAGLGHLRIADDSLPERLRQAELKAIHKLTRQQELDLHSEEAKIKAYLQRLYDRFGGGDETPVHAFPAGPYRKKRAKRPGVRASYPTAWPPGWPEGTPSFNNQAARAER